MKRIAHFLKMLLPVMLVCVIGCSDDEPIVKTPETPELPGPPKQELIDVLASGILGKSSATRMTYEDLAESVSYQWEQSDRITVCFKHEYDGVYNEWKNFTLETSQKETATFKGQFTKGELINFPDSEWKYMWAISPAAPRLEESHWSTSVLCKAFEQKITEGKNALSAAYTTARAEYKPGQKVSFSFQPRMAVLTFRLTLPSEFNSSAIKAFQIKGTGLYATRVLNLEAPKEPYFEWKQAAEGAINVNFSGKLPIKDNMLTATVFAFPSEKIESLSLQITDGSNKEYTVAIKEIKALESGLRYTINKKVNTPNQIIQSMITQELTTASIYSNGRFIARYALYTDEDKLNLTYFEGRDLKHKTVDYIRTSEHAIDFEDIALSTTKLTGFTYESGTIKLKGTNISNYVLKSQKDVIEKLSATGSVYWSTEALCKNGKKRTKNGDAKTEFNTEFNSNIYMEFLCFNQNGYKYPLFYSGITSHGDVIYKNNCNALRDLCKSGENDILLFTLNDPQINYGGGGTFPNFSADENKATDAPRRYFNITMPKSLAAWSHTDGLIIAEEAGIGETFYYFLSPTTDSWFKFSSKKTVLE